MENFFKNRWNRQRIFRVGKMEDFCHLKIDLKNSEMDFLWIFLHCWKCIQKFLQVIIRIFSRVYTCKHASIFEQFQLNIRENLKSILHRLARLCYSSLYLQYSHRSFKVRQRRKFHPSSFCKENLSIFRFILISWRIDYVIKNIISVEQNPSQVNLTHVESSTNLNKVQNQSAKSKCKPVTIHPNKNVDRQMLEASLDSTAKASFPCLNVHRAAGPSESVTLLRIATSLSLNLFLRFSLIRGRAYLGISFGSKLLTLDTSVVNSAFTRLPGYPLFRLTSCQPFERKRRGHRGRDRPRWTYLSSQSVQIGRADSS